MLTESSATVSGTLNGDGSLVLDERLRLPPGRVQVTVQPETKSKQASSMMETLKRIWADQDARGYVPRSGEEMDAQLRELRDEWDERDAFLERIRRGEPLETSEPTPPEQES